MDKHSSNPPTLIITMGVSGCGKSTLGEHLAKAFNFTFLEADDFHSKENKAHMANGKPLTDAMREPWIQAMCDTLRELQAKGQSSVLAYSGLRRAHRQKFRGLGYPTLFLHLSGPKDLIRERMQERTEHFMPADLLDSQYAALEAAENEPDIIEIDLAQTIPEIIAQATELTQRHASGTLSSK